MTRLPFHLLGLPWPLVGLGVCVWLLAGIAIAALVGVQLSDERELEPVEPRHVKRLDGIFDFEEVEPGGAA